MVLNNKGRPSEDVFIREASIAQEAVRRKQRSSYVPKFLRLEDVRSVVGIKLYDVLAARQKWHFVTVNKDGSPTGVTVAAIGYTPLARPPTALYNAIVAIDLYEVQQAVLASQIKRIIHKNPL
ncbi:1865_t:CDS:2 [Paraglomus brasilianum]|uniref:1865_t:CDS:1 n=1 Tax=Paraglomus brasilianum TaxID=144538 RepID=A0A9N9GVV7_9GLOM|nr:1865_t:CDS:2 [Paraglomus brasilianum]